MKKADDEALAGARIGGLARRVGISPSWSTLFREPAQASLS
jgi:hypothetical protein